VLKEQSSCYLFTKKVLRWIPAIEELLQKYESKTSEISSSEFVKLSDKLRK